VSLIGNRPINGSGYFGHFRVYLFPILVFAFTSSQSAFAEWSVQPSVRAGQEYNDNFNLTADPLAVWNTNFRGSLRSTFKTEQSQTDFFGEYRGFRYLNESNLNADDGTVRLTTNHISEYNLFELSGEAILDHPSSAQLQAGNQNFNRIERLRWNISPSWTWTPNEYSKLQLYYRYDNISYDENPNIRTTRSDFFSHSANSSYTYALEEYTSIFGNISFIENVNDELNFKSDQISLQVGINHSFSETFDISMSGGGVILLSETEIPRLVLNPATSTFNIVSEKVSNSQSGYIMNISVNKTFSHTKLTAQYFRNLTPTINGGQVIEDNFSLSAWHQISEYLHTSIGIGASQLDSIQSTLSQADRRNIYARISFSWQFFEGWWLDGGYRYRWLDREGIGARDGNSVYVNLRFDWSPILFD